MHRFSAVLKNLGGAIDLYMDPNTGAAMQVLWPNGNPSVKPDPNKEPNRSLHKITTLLGYFPHKAA